MKIVPTQTGLKAGEFRLLDSSKVQEFLRLLALLFILEQERKLLARSKRK